MADTIDIIYRISSDSGGTWGSEVNLVTRNDDTVASIMAPQVFDKVTTFGYPWCTWINGSAETGGSPMYIAIDTMAISLPRRKTSHKLSL